MRVRFAGGSSGWFCFDGLLMVFRFAIRCDSVNVVRADLTRGDSLLCSKRGVRFDECGALGLDVVWMVLHHPIRREPAFGFDFASEAVPCRLFNEEDSG